MAKRFSSAVLILAPTLALAQASAGQILVSESNTVSNDGIINIEECKGTVQGQTETISITWTLSSSPAGLSTTKLFASDTTDCPLPANGSTPKTTELLPTTVNGVSGRFPSSGGVSPTDIISKSPLTFNCTATTTQTVILCAVGQDSAGTIVTRASGVLTVDTTIPPIPINVTVRPGDGVLHVQWDVGTGGTGSGRSYEISATPTGGGAARTTEVTGRTDGDIGNLENNVSYDVVVTALSQGRNRSAPSGTVAASPVPVNDFWRIYQNAGGREQGGCGVGGAGLLALLVVPLALRALRRRS